MLDRALVLGAGGHAAIAWEIGVIVGLSDVGVDVRTADLFVGTSAGSVVAAQLNAGLSLEELFLRQTDATLQASEPTPPVDFQRWRAELLRAKQAGGSAPEFLRQVGMLRSTVPATAEFDRRRIIASRLPVHTWPQKKLLIAAVDVQSGARKVFDTGSNVELIDAVTASCAVAGIWPAVSIQGRPYIDGGFYSIDNADLAANVRGVLILTFPTRVPPLCVITLEQALETLLRGGSTVEVVHPDEASEAAFASVGGNFLDPTIRRSAALAGREQGRALAGRLVSFWSS